MAVAVLGTLEQPPEGLLERFLAAQPLPSRQTPARPPSQPPAPRRAAREKGPGDKLAANAALLRRLAAVQARRIERRQVAPSRKEKSLGLLRWYFFYIERAADTTSTPYFFAPALIPVG
jgi:hypothetical protein